MSEQTSYYRMKRGAAVKEQGKLLSAERIGEVTWWTEDGLFKSKLSHPSFTIWYLMTIMATAINTRKYREFRQQFSRIFFALLSWLSALESNERWRLSSNSQRNVQRHHPNNSTKMPSTRTTPIAPPHNRWPSITSLPSKSTVRYNSKGVSSRCHCRQGIFDWPLRSWHPSK